jgi:hypothetical protein
MSRQSHVLALCAGIAVFIAGAAWIVASLTSDPAASAHAPAKAGTNAENDARLGQIQAQVEGLGQLLEAQQREIARLRQDAGVADRPAGNAGESYAAGPVSEDAEALAEESRDERRLAELETAFASQGDDPRWSRRAEGQIATAVGQVAEASGKDVGEGPQLQDADCRTNLCRFALTHTDEVAAERFMQEFPHRLNWRQTHGRVQLVQNADGSVSTVVYLSREGHSLYGSQ